MRSVHSDSAIMVNQNERIPLPGNKRRQLAFALVKIFIYHHQDPPPWPNSDSAALTELLAWPSTEIPDCIKI